MPIDKNTARDIAYDVKSYVETAVGEMGYDEYLQEEYKSRIKEAKRHGVRDIGGWLADELYNDAGTVNDLSGDNIYSQCAMRGIQVDDDVFKTVATELQSLMHHVKIDF